MGSTYIYMGNINVYLQAKFLSFNGRNIRGLHLSPPPTVEGTNVIEVTLSQFIPAKLSHGSLKKIFSIIYEGDVQFRLMSDFTFWRPASYFDTPGQILTLQ